MAATAVAPPAVPDTEEGRGGRAVGERRSEALPLGVQVQSKSSPSPVQVQSQAESKSIELLT